MDINNKISNNLKSCLKKASLLAQENNQELDLSIFLLALLETKNSIAKDLFVKNKTDLDKIKKILLNPKINKTVDNKSSITSLETLLIKAFNLAHKNHHTFVGTEHCLSVLLSDTPYIVKYIIKHFNINTTIIKKQINSLLKGNSKIPQMGDLSSQPDLPTGFDDPSISSQNILELFSTNLTDFELQKNINPIISREQEIDRMIQILCRKDKNNPIILGDPGVGKTAIVEGLAKKILEGEVPNILKDKTILSLDLTSILAGTMYRGDFENRLKTIVEEVKNNPNLIIFIDEIHNIMGAGASQGTMDAANILKPLLARGQIRCIGATTMEEYKKFIEKDPALERRFQAVILSEPNKASAISILRGIKNNYEKYHQVKFDDSALETAVNLSHRYIQDKLLPDKAIDLIDEAAAKMRIAKSNSAVYSKIKSLENHLYKTTIDKDQAIRMEDFNQALKLKDKEKLIKNQLQELINQTNKNNDINPPIITNDHIIELLAEKTKIPINELTYGENSQLKTLEKDLQKNIIGQNQAISKISQMIKRAKLGLANENQPLTSLLLLGPSGVGKTFTAKKLAELLFHDQEAFVRIDMSEYSEKINATKLIGAPAGYVGYRETNKLTDSVKKRPYSLVLFDEIEKAHPDVINLLLQVLEDGHLTDSSGKKVNFKNTIIIMTSNIGAEIFNKGKMIGFGNINNEEEIQNKIIGETKKVLRPEFISRINKIIHYNKLQIKDLEKIIKNELDTKQNNLLERGYIISISSQKIKSLAQKCYELDNGARGVRQIIEEHIENPLIDKILSNKNKKLVIN